MLRHRRGYRRGGARLVAEHVLDEQSLQPDCLAVDLEERSLLLKDRRLLLGDCLQDFSVGLVHLPSADHSSGCCSAIATASALSCVTVPPRICTSLSECKFDRSPSSLRGTRVSGSRHVGPPRCSA